METILPSAPQNYKQLIKTSFSLYRSVLPSVLMLALLLAFTVFVPRLLSSLIGENVFLALPPFSPYRLWLLVVNLASMVLLVAILWRIHCFIRGKHEPLLQDLTKGFKKLFYVFIATLIQSTIVFAVFLVMYGLSVVLHINQLFSSQHFLGITLTILIFALQLFLMVYIYTLFVFFIPLIAVESKNIFTSLEYSLLLSWNHWWRVFSVQLTPWICYFLTLIIIRYALHINIHIYFLYQAQSSFVIAIGQLLLFALFIPWVGSLLLVQLNDLELRRKAK